MPKDYKGIVDQIAQGNEYWSVQLNVAVVQGDTILYHGNIAESADWRNGFLEQKYMRPPITATLDELHSFGFNYNGFFVIDGVSVIDFVQSAKPMFFNYPRLKTRQLLGEFSRAIYMDVN